MYAGIFLTLGAALCGSAGYICIKRGLEAADYRVFISLSVLIGILLSGLLLWSVGPGLSGLTFFSVFPFIITGGLGGGLLARISETIAADEIGVSKTHALVSASPLITAVLGVTILDEIVSLRLSLGTLIVVSGASFLSYLSFQRDTDNPQIDQSRPLLGLSLAFYATLLLGIQPVLQRLGLKLGALPLQAMFIRFATATFFYGTYLVVKRPPLKVRNHHEAVYFLFAGIAWALAPLLILFALGFISATVFAPISRVGPLFTVIFTRLFLKGIEEVNWQVGLSALLIVLGVILVSTA